MFGKARRRREAKQRQQEELEKRYRQREERAKEIFRGLFALRNLDPSKLPEAVTALLREARHQQELLGQSMADRTGYKSTLPLEPAEGDLACWTAEETVEMVRENTTAPQTVFQALSEQIPDVRFTVDWFDACSYVAAELRTERVIGVYEGLKLAGIIQEEEKLISPSSEFFAVKSEPG